MCLILQPIDIVDDSYFYEDLQPDAGTPVPESSTSQSAPQNVPQPSAQPAVDLTPIRLKSQQASQQPDNLREGYTLRMLFKHPTIYYEVNRKLHELADNDTSLLQEPLVPFGVGDFTRAVYRALMQMFLFGIKQAEADLLDFLQDELDPAMKADLDRLLQDESLIVRDRMRERYEADREELWNNHTNRFAAALQPAPELLTYALELRRVRLIQALEELRLSQQFAQGEEAGVMRVLVIRRALEKIDTALNQQRQQFA